MSIFKRSILLVFFLASFTSHAYDFLTNPRVKFEKYSIRDGLSHLGVSSFFQDNKGYLWIGTFDGLNRFDGLNFKTFKHIPDDSTTLVNNRVRCILEHSSGRLFIGTEGGICIYNSEYETFEQFRLGTFDDPTVGILKIFEDTDKRLWILTNMNVAYVVDLETMSVRSFSLIHSGNNFMSNFLDIIEDKNGFFWMASSLGLVCCSKNLQVVPLNLPKDLGSSEIRSVVLDGDNYLWVSVSNSVQKLKLDYKEDSIEVQIVKPYEFKSAILSMLIDSRDNVWAGSSNDGVFRILKNDATIENYSYKPSLKESISSNWVSNIYEDNAGNIWFGTAEKGINKYSCNKEMFLTIDRSLGLRSNYVLELYQYDKELVLCGTRNGLSVYNFLKEQIVEPWFDISPVVNSQIASFYKDSRNTLWIGASNGLYFLNQGRSELANSQSLFPSLQVVHPVVSMIEDKFGNLWIGSNAGIFRMTFDNEGKSIDIFDFNSRDDNIVKNVKVSEFYFDPLDSTLWLGSWYNGLFHISYNGNERNVNDFKIDNYKFQPKHPETLRSNFVSTIIRGKNGNLWVGTEGGGFSLLNEDKESSGFAHFTQENGLSNNVVKSIMEDDSGELYIGTNFKMNVFNPNTNSFRYYDVNDGLKSDYFNRVATKLGSGEMMFGGNEGITILDTKREVSSTWAPTPEFGEFQLSFKTIIPGEEVDGRVILEKGLSHTENLELKYFQNTFSIELLGISFDDPEDNLYKYRLTGYDQNWILSKPSDKMASYSNIPPGDYIFEFHIVRNKSEWSDNPRKLEISLSPPFWKTNWAYSLYFILITGVVISVFFFFLNIVRLKSNLRIEQLEKNKEKEINDFKLKYFTNISHEFKTPVSLILGPVESLLKNFRENDGNRRNLLMIHEQANYLIRLLDQLLEFRKVENEAVNLKCSEQDIIIFLKHICNGFKSKAVEKNLRFNFLHDEDAIMLWFDPFKMEMVINNLLSNAFKFTPAGGEVTVAIEKSPQEAVFIYVRDTGQGIPHDEQDKVFERFYQSRTNQNIHGGYGIGLALSRSLVRLHHGDLTVESNIGQGSSFSLKLMLGNKHFTPNEIWEGKPIAMDHFDTFNEMTDISLTDMKDLSSERKDLPVILVIEDNLQMRTYLEDILVRHYHVFTADNGISGFDTAINKMPDLIISDVMMPGLDGVQLTEKLKNEINTSHIPIILLTANNEFTSFLKGIEKGADDYISKPFHVEHLLVRVRNLLENRKRLRNRYGRSLNETVVEPEDQFSDKDREFVQTLFEIAENNLDNADFSADDFSKAVYMSRTNFYKKLKSLTDHTPGSFLRSYRIKRAKELLSTGNYNICQVVSMVGFKSRSHFYHCFQDQYNDLPSDVIRKSAEIINHQSLN